MYSSNSKGFALLVYALFYFFLSSVEAQEQTSISSKVVFNVQPQQCVTLRQGRDCFATITIQWEKNAAQALCLYQIVNKELNNKEQLKCWSKSSMGKASIEFESNDNLTYQLRTQKGDLLLAETEIVVSWLHKNTTRRRRWRLF
jgi:hypothetical protein